MGWRQDGGGVGLGQSGWIPPVEGILPHGPPFFPGVVRFYSRGNLAGKNVR
jgi:hypothetical protein